jgi:membrane protein
MAISELTDAIRQRQSKCDRGRSADYPAEIPHTGWRDILLRVWQRLGEDNVSLISAGIALNTSLAIFPALAVAVSLYGMFASPLDVAVDVKPFFDLLPQDAAQLIQAQLQNIAKPADRTLGFGAVLGALLAIWSARQGIVALMTASNIAYHETERRSYFRQLVLSLAFTLGGVVAFLSVLLLGIAVPVLLKTLPLGAPATTAVLVLHWVMLWVVAALAAAVIYRHAASRQRPKWRWVAYGSVIAATLWLIGSILFALYVQNFGSYGKTYGALGGVIVLLLWFYLGGFAVVLGAVINAEMERQTAVDTTAGPTAPMGQRGAYVADTVGRTTE